MKVSFYAPSYKRPEKSITQINYPFVKLVVRESDADEYRYNGNDIIVVPDTAQGNVCRIRNYILDNLSIIQIQNGKNLKKYLKIIF